MSILRGVVRLAMFRADGFEEFTPTPQSLLNALAPLLAFPLVTAVAQAMHGNVVAALTAMLGTVVALLTPLLVTQALAQRWGSGALWLRFAVGYCWVQLGFSVAALLLIGILPVFALLVFYGVALHWFLARAGLDLSRGRAALLIVVADMLTGALYLGPQILAAVGKIPPQ
jgi:hypothetical protein